MDEELGIRMTRSRRRLSIEQSDEIPSSPATPTKKRSSKLPKPQLDNIVENDVVEQLKNLSKRSIALEYKGGEDDKLSTPGRVARAMSNTSLSENVQVLDSPRAKRALRRNSLAGSDNETISTPVRRSRRISKEFNKSPELPTVDQKRHKKGNAADALGVMQEESDKKDKGNFVSPSKNNESLGKLNQSPGEMVSEDVSNLATVLEESGASDKGSPVSVRKSLRLSLKKTKDVPETCHEDKSIDNKVDTKEKIETKDMSASRANKSLPIMGAKEVSKNRKRSKSFTKCDTNQKGDSYVYYSDNESRKVKFRKNRNIEDTMILESNKIGDHEIVNTTKINSCDIYENKENVTEKSLSRNLIQWQVLSDKKVRKSSINNSSIIISDGSTKEPYVQNKSEVEYNKSTNSSHSLKMDENNDKNEIKTCSAMFMVESNIIEQTSMITNDCSQKIINVFESGTGNNAVNDTCEPMDVDETIPLTDFKNTSLNSTQKRFSKSELDFNDMQQNIQINDNNSLRDSKAKIDSFCKHNKSEVPKNKSNNEDKSCNSNKSTLIFSVDNIDKSNEENKSLTTNENFKLVDVNVKKENLSLAGPINITPIRHKMSQNIGVVTSTPVLTQGCAEPEEKSKRKKIKIENNNSKQESNNSVDTENYSDSDANSLLDDEAEDVGDEYESGDSQDESEREYAEQNTIPVAGETLESEDEKESNDSEYKKDSFLVSSDECDNELLSGSGDDLSMSDNELKMTSKSKDKHNRRKIKEQKLVSREMFNSRHGKSLGSDQDDSDCDIIFANKNRKRLRLNSSKDVSDSKICQDEPEISIISNKSSSAKDPLFNASIKKEILDITCTNNKTLQEIENITVDQNLTIFTNKETSNPLNSDEESMCSESSGNADITNNYDDLLKTLNNSPGTNNSKNLSSGNVDANISEKESNVKIYKPAMKNTDGKKKNLSMSELYCTKSKKDNSILDKLNLTSGKERKRSCPTQTTNDEDSKSLKFETSVTNLCLNTSSSKRKPGMKDQSLTKINKNNSICESSKEDTVSLLESISNDGIDVIDNINSEIKDHSEVDVQDILSEKALGKQKFITTKAKQRLGNDIDMKTSTQNSDDSESSVSIDFKLLFPQDEDSSNTPGNEEEDFIPLKKSQAQINLLENTSLTTDIEGATNERNDNNTCVINNSKNAETSKKRKRRQFENGDQDLQGVEKTSKKFKSRGDDIPMSSVVNKSENKIKIQRLPVSIIEKLDEKPRKLQEKNAKSVISTANFEVKTISSKRNIPSAYLEDSVHIDVTPPRCHNQKVANLIRKPKVLPSLPKASTSTVGFTSNFKVNILKQEKRHDAKLAGPDINIINFKSERLYGSNMKRIATEELCRKQKKIKMTKF